MKRSCNKCENPKAKGETLIPGTKMPSHRHLSLLHYQAAETVGWRSGNASSPNYMAKENLKPICKHYECKGSFPLKLETDEGLIISDPYFLCIQTGTKRKFFKKIPEEPEV